jgi:hypothetical protein
MAEICDSRRFYNNLRFIQYIFLFVNNYMSKDNIIESYLLEGTIKLLGWSDDDEDFKNYKTWTSTGLGLEFIMKISNNRFYK